MIILKDISNNTKEGVRILFSYGLNPIIENTITKFENKEEFLKLMIIFHPYKKEQ